MDRAGGGVRDAVHGQVPEALLSQEPGTQHFTLDDDDSVPELGGSRPDRIATCLDRRSRICGAPWVRSSTQSLRCLFSTILCRRWENSCRTSCTSSARSRLILSRLSKCPRSCSMLSLCALLSVIRSWGNSWWKCRRSLGTSLWFSPRRSIRGESYDVLLQSWREEGAVHVEVFKVLVLDRIQQSIWSRSLKIQFLRFGGKVVEVFKVLSQYRIQQRLWSRSLTFQLVGVFLVFSRDRVLLPHPVVRMTLRMRILHGFSHFSPFEKKCEVGLALGVGTAPRVEPIHAASS